ncbi:decaprenyl-phosphate phosphoribosyltransferase [Winogradskyella sp.]|uniref:decaprenyl-phosphate phosphoribosyltransferase n=1 Tax=Winogradskyella sp. TaxID=1883156 RepID=UPI003BAC4D47
MSTTNKSILSYVMFYKTLNEFLRLMRLKHWAKNLFIFLPLFFAGKMMELDLVINASIVFISFSFAASAVYILNDWCDVERDRAHPTKKDRPLAAGKVKPWQALILGLILIFVAFTISIFILDGPWATIILGYYVAQNILYTFKLKHYAIVDVTIIAIGFVLRIIIGGIVTDIELSQWIIILTFLLSLFLALSKRRDDIVVLMNTNTKLRKSLDGYSLKFIDTSMSISAVIIVLAYLMYTLSPEIVARYGEYIYITTFFVFIGILQYLKLTQVMENSSSPTKLLFKNLFLQLIILGWIGCYIILIYFL